MSHHYASNFENIISVHIYIYEKVLYFCCCFFCFVPPPLLVFGFPRLSSSFWGMFMSDHRWSSCCPLLGMVNTTTIIIFFSLIVLFHLPSTYIRVTIIHYFINLLEHIYGVDHLIVDFLGGDTRILLAYSRESTSCDFLGVRG